MKGLRTSLALSLLLKDAAAVDRFHSLLARGEGCWLWQAGAGANGYGAFNYGGISLAVHRIAFALHHQRLPRLMVCHHCDTRLCGRPSHLFEGTAADNLADMRAKGRQGRHSWCGERAGERNANAKLTPEAVLSIRADLDQGLTQRGVAAVRGVSPSTVRDIRTRRIWSDL